MSPTPHTHTPQSQGGRPPTGPSQQAPSIDTTGIRLGKQIDPELYAAIAHRAAETIAGSGRRDQNKGTQLRRFYDELCHWNDKINGRGTKDERARRYGEFAPLVKMLKAKVAYAEGRGHIDKNFEKLFRHVVDEVKDAPTLEQAKLFMEAFMGFYKATNKG
jgi:CRISPR-associated protein Csm2